MIARLMALASVAATASAWVAPTTAATLVAPVTEPAKLPFAVQFDLASKIIARTYRIYVAKPFAAPPKRGWPVIYVLDADIVFATAATQMMLRNLGGASGAIVVGIGYPETRATGKLREYDLTPSAPMPGTDDARGAKPGDHGGAALFHRVMIEELRPQIAAMAPVDQADQSLIGYSLGGLFALGVLFDHPGAYRTIVAGSPSIWWNEREILQKEAAFAAAVKAGKVATRLLITSDTWEQFPADGDLPSDPKKRAAARKGAADAAMVDNAKDLAGRLGALKGAPGYRVRFVLFPEETHLTGVPASTSRGVAFTFIP